MNALSNKFIAMLLIFVISALPFRFLYAEGESSAASVNHHAEMQMHYTQNNIATACENPQLTHCKYGDCSQSHCALCGGLLQIISILNPSLPKNQWQQAISVSYLPNYPSALFRPPKV